MKTLHGIQLILIIIALFILYGLLIISLFVLYGLYKEQEKLSGGQTPEKAVDIAINPVQSKLWTLEDLLNAIEQIESGGNPKAVGDGGDAVGNFQIHKIYVDDVNRILALQGKKGRFNYKDRWDKTKSREIAEIYLRYYNHNTPTNGKSQYPFGNMSWQERLARIHNGGSTGYKKESTKPYWEKVKRELEGE